jgi:hypothetical protein
MFLNIKSFVLISSVLFFLSACSENKPEEVDTSDDEAISVGLDSQKISAQNVFNTIPSRDILINLIKQANTEYNVTYLSNPDDVSKYFSESSRALNLGVYGADLNVASIYNQTQESMLFFKCVNIIAKNIGVSNSFDENMGDRMNANQTNRDSTLNIISQAFKSADNTLRKNGRPGTSSLLITGAWVEGLYIACQTAKESKNEAMIKEIFNQNESLTNLIELIEVSKLTSEAEYVLTDLKSVKKVIESKTDKVFTLDALKELDAKITEIRTKIISTK